MEKTVKREAREETDLSPARLQSFSDGVFAVAITLLVLTIHLPERNIPSSQLWTQLRALWPNYFAYILSFVIIGLFWIGHHSVFRWFKRDDRVLLILNLLFLMLIVFVPFPTTVLSDYGGTRTAVIFYAASLAACALSLCLLVWYAVSENRLVAEDFDHEMSRHVIIKYLNLSFVFLASIGVAFINVQAAQYFWILIWVNEVIIERLHRKRMRSPLSSS